MFNKNKIHPYSTKNTILCGYDPTNYQIINYHRGRWETNHPRSSIGGQSLVADSSLAQEDVQLKEWSVVVVFCVS